MLDLFAIWPWTAYELTERMRHSLHYLWPKSESLRYAEPKKLVDQGLAHVTYERRGERTRAQYRIADTGRRAVEAWLDAEPAAPLFEIEAMLRVTFADQGTAEQLSRALRSAAAWAASELGRARPRSRTARHGWPFPERLHLIAIVVGFYGELFDLMRRYVGGAADLVESWDTTSGAMTDATLREMLERTLRRAETAGAP